MTGAVQNRGEPLLTYSSRCGASTQAVARSKGTDGETRAKFTYPAFLSNKPTAA